MANLWEQSTGVKGTIWVCTKHTKCDKPQLIYVVGNDELSISIEEGTILTPKKLEGTEPTNSQLIEWLKLNRQILLDYWYEKMDTKGLIQNLKKYEPFKSQRLYI